MNWKASLVLASKPRIPLLREFKSVKKIRETSLPELEQVIGKSRAKIVYSALHDIKE
jgi:excinuclease UvrABC nuclease subunit